MSIILLCAGRSTRMSDNHQHKLLCEFDGVSLVRRSASAASASQASTVFAVTGHRRFEIEAALEGVDIAVIFNPFFGSGIASSITAGWRAAQAGGADGCLIMLADMPFISSFDLDRLIAAFKEAGGRAIVQAAGQGRPGNPVILPRSLHQGILELQGDLGARGIIGHSKLARIQVDIGQGAHIDVDTPEAIVAAGGMLKG
ncbi:nucleotidyltransferase family protein [Rhizobium sp. L43]|uniref:nucleotidyltransferase family protein n=1 Tax=Rhizobium sp. L43 TaxID=2035452 RepID=UPI0032AF3D6A